MPLPLSTREISFFYLVFSISYGKPHTGIPDQKRSGYPQYHLIFYHITRGYKIFVTNQPHSLDLSLSISHTLYQDSFLVYCENRFLLSFMCYYQFFFTLFYSVILSFSAFVFAFIIFLYQRRILFLILWYFSF